MTEIPDPRQQAADKRRAREQRIRDLRTRVVAVAVALFVAVWAGLYLQLVSGNDPALADETTPVTQPAVTDESASNDTSTETWSDDASATTEPSPEPAAVTTGQS